MNTFVRIVVNVPSVAGLFDYAVPEALAGKIGVGHLVIVPFGKQTTQGVVFRFIDQPSVQAVKEILELVDEEPVLTQPQIALAEEMATSTLQPLAAVVGLFLPVGLSQQVDTIYELRIIAEHPVGTNYEYRTEAKTINPATQRLTIEDRILSLLKMRGPLRGRQIDTHFAKVDWRKTAGFLVKKGVLSAKSILPPPRVRSKFIRVAQLAVPPEEAESEMPNLGTKQTLARRQSALKFLIHQPDAINLSWVYANSGCNLADLQELEERGLIRLFESEIFRDPLEGARKQVETYTGKQVLELTLEQNRALKEIMHAITLESDSLLSDKKREHTLTGTRAPALQSNIFLLQGVTGSGKTEIYIRATEEVIKRGKQAIILVPEIALTPQVVRRFLSRFPGQVGIVHSKLSEGERYDTWRRARSGKLKVIIGARSALFAPLPNIGLIVADECHDSSYHQSEPPFYHAVHAAQVYARLCGAVCVLGSATPTIEQRYQADSSPLLMGEGLGVRVLRKLDLPKRIQTSEVLRDLGGLPPVHIVDMRDELKAGSRGIFSRILLNELESTLKRGEQAILFLNRRGTATYIFCRDCGYVLKCPNCETPLTLHVENKERLLCHHCGYERGKPRSCPQCNGKQIREYGLGSEKVEEEINTLFPKARTLRWDWDTTRKKDAHEMILTHFANHQADILVGTQMLAKGLDLPLVTLVGIVLADVGLNLPDPFAGERVFQVLTQVAGRAGRSERGGKVVLQTFEPEHQVIQFAAKHDVNGFYEYELEQRKRLGYPPFSRLVRLEYRDQDQASAEKEAQRVAIQLSHKGTMSVNSKQSAVIGPVPCFFAKNNSEYRWQIILRGADPQELLRELKLDGWRVEVDPISLL